MNKYTHTHTKAISLHLGREVRGQGHIQGRFVHINNVRAYYLLISWQGPAVGEVKASCGGSSCGGSDSGCTSMTVSEAVIYRIHWRTVLFLLYIQNQTCAFDITCLQIFMLLNNGKIFLHTFIQNIIYVCGCVYLCVHVCRYINLGT